MRKATIGAIKIGTTLGAFALVLAFLGMYLVPVTAQGSGTSGPYFTANSTYNSTPRYQPGAIYGFMVNITNSTHLATGNVTNVTFQFGYPNGTLVNYTNYTTTTVLVKNNTPGVFFINFTAGQLGGAGAFNYTWFANASYTPAQGNNLNWTDTIGFTVDKTLMTNLSMNLTYVNSSGYVNNFAALAAFSPQFLAQVAFSTPVSACTHNNMTVNYTPSMGSNVVIPANESCNYTVTTTLTDFISQSDQIFNSTIEIRSLNMSIGGIPVSTEIQLLPLGTYGKGSPSQKSILGGFAFNSTNINATGSYLSVSYALARRGYMPDGLYKCANWNQSTVGENKQVCSNWAAATVPATDAGNTTYLNKTITSEQNFTFYGYSEPFYNLRPLVKVYGNASNITTVNIVNWANFRSKYYSWVPMMKFNMTSKQPYLPSADAYAEAMYYDVPFFANPSAIEMFSYNLTVNITFAADPTINNRTVGISISPRVIRDASNPDPATNVLSGTETPLMPAWSVQAPQEFQGANVSRTILRPTFNTIYYTYNGVTCGPYNNATNVGQGANPSAVFTNSSLPYPCNYTLSYDYTNNELNLTLPNTTAGTVPLSVLYSLSGRQTEGSYSPVYLVNQTFIGGFVPGPGREPPAMGSASDISFVVKVNNSLKNFTSSGADLFVHFLYPENVTLWNNNSLSTVNMSVQMGSGFQLWQLNDTIVATSDSAVNASASNDVNTSTGRVWMMIANKTHLWNLTTLTYNTTNPISFFVNRTTSCSNVTENFPGSPSNGKNLTICFQEFDFNLTSINSWLPNDAKSNVTLNLTATLNVSILNSLRVGSGAAGATTQFNASISTASAGEIRLSDTQLPGFTSGNCGTDFSNCSKTIIVDGQPLNSSSYRTGSIILNLASGTHAVSVTYAVPAAAASATTTSSTDGSSSTTSVDAVTKKVTKTYTSITANTPRTIYESELKDTDTGLNEITINVKNLATNVKITVEKLAGKPASITQEVTAGKVYKFMNISKENLADNNIDKVKIKFKVEKNWLTVNGFNASNIVLKRYTSQWDKLNTSKISEDKTYVYYSADTPGFSVFAVAADKEVTAPPSQPEQSQESQEPAQEEQPQQGPVAEPVDMTVAYILTAVVIIAGGLLYFTEVKKKSDKKK